MKRVVCGLLLSLVCVLTTTEDAWACTCVKRDFSRLYGRASVVFAGRMVGRTDDGARAIFVVYDAQKGLDASTRRVEVDTRKRTSCKFVPSPGAMHQILANRRKDGTLVTGYCSGSVRKYRVDPEDLERGLFAEMQEALAECTSKNTGFGASPPSLAKRPIRVTMSLDYADRVVRSYSLDERTWGRLEPGWRELRTCVTRRMGTQLLSKSSPKSGLARYTVSYDAVITHRKLVLSNPALTKGDVSNEEKTR